ncbi:GTPase-activating protein [Wickerhamomyces ciferrii]|uniref:GTPase-activating protein n=1 Tax=Wickerhamomyces ciferrii (strain ATCC 14091 / BCRC 22168 / CBS 111 / JCM 3599 / NBRC 0793 / NRRL Y-1031 F-60-10) TaxID=1206466 RepID=K0KPF2_WICCF|nr:GTPase-activating protein [Wickerhamomyces ciferrii]CCH43023.1 GTPase-activating protein [Wickerhamomyces ciferrii]
MKVVGASFSHLGLGNSDKSSSSVNLPSTSNSIKSSKPKIKPIGRNSSFKIESPSSTPRHSDQYTDLDDDWDADVGQGLSSTESQPKFLQSKPSRSFDYPSLSKSNHKRSESGVKKHVDGIIKDPANSLYTLYGPNITQEDKSIKEIEELNAIVSKFNRFKAIIQDQNINLVSLRKMAWNGIPSELRPISWQLLLGYLPTNSDRRVTQLSKKRQEYLGGISQVFNDNKEPATWHQIEIDIPRTNPHIKLYNYECTQRSLERILYLWAVRHPASGYVQGINDLATPFFQTFLSSYVESDIDIETFDPKVLPKQVLDAVEADTFWCLTKLLDGIQDNYIHAQPGIIRQVNTLKDLINRIDSSLYTHLENESIEFIQFSFRWMNCLLMREISVKNTIRMWDTYLSETNGFSEFHIYVCAAFLVKWSDELKAMDFQEIMMFLQNPPTKTWTEKDIELLLSEAFIWQSLYKNASAHLRA